MQKMREHFEIPCIVVNVWSTGIQSVGNLQRARDVRGDIWWQVSAHLQLAVRPGYHSADSLRGQAQGLHRRRSPPETERSQRQTGSNT